MPRTYYDDNFGHYDIEDEGDVEFYNHMQSVSVRKKCAGCGHMVKIHPDYAYCNGCVETLE
ncbi:MAG: hypothetical protein AB7L09_21410 [Nitrospira sp.]